jgi:hypothetical protein
MVIPGSTNKVTDVLAAETLLTIPGNPSRQYEVSSALSMFIAISATEALSTRSNYLSS